MLSRRGAAFEMRGLYTSLAGCRLYLTYEEQIFSSYWDRYYSSIRTKHREKQAV